jgi:hypothetical protein
MLSFFSQGNGCLHYAACCGREELFQWAFEKGLRISSLNSEDKSPVWWAKKNKRKQMLALMKELDPVNFQDLYDGKRKAEEAVTTEVDTDADVGAMSAAMSAAAAAVGIAAASSAIVMSCVAQGAAVGAAAGVAALAKWSPRSTDTGKAGRTAPPCGPGILK